MLRRHFLPSLLVSAQLPGQTPPLRWADSSRLGRPYSKDPSVVRFQGRYLMYFSLPGDPPPPGSTAVPKGRGWGIGIAESRDLKTWKKVGEVPPEQDVEANGICAPGARVVDGKVHLFYQTYGNGRLDAICHAESSDGLSFKRDGCNPVFRPTGAWNCGRAIDADVIRFRGRWYLYAATRDPGMKIQMVTGAVAEPAAGFGQGAWKMLGDAPLLKPELPWERDCIEAPSVLERGGALFMFYAGGYNNAPQQIGCARSTDGIRWQRLFEQPLLANGRPGEWNSSESGHPGVFVDDDGTTWLFFQGNNDGGKTWWLSWRRVEWMDGLPRMVPEG